MNNSTRFLRRRLDIRAPTNKQLLAGEGRALLLVIAMALPARALHTQTACMAVSLLEGTPRKGFSIDLRTQYFLIPSRVVSGLKLQPVLTLGWAASDRFAMTFDAQTVDNSGPGRQGRYRASRTLAAEDAGSGNFFQEQTLGARWLVANSCRTGGAIALGASISRGVRSYVLRDTATGSIAEGDNQDELVPTLDASVEVRRPRWRSALGVALAFFPANNALYLRRLPDASGDAFGTTVGMSLDGAVLVANAALRARLFAPLTGANTIRRESGRTVRWPVYHVGLSHAVNPVLATDFFLTNALGGGGSGALALVADREYAALGGGVRYTSAGRKSNRVVAQPNGGTPVVAGASPSLLDQSFAGGLKMSLAGGSGGTNASLGGSPVPDLALGATLDYVNGTLDEGDLGGFVAVRFVRQSPRAPVAVSVLFAASRSNNVLVNLLAQRADEFARRGLKKSGFRFGDESVADGKLYLLTAAVPLRRDFANGAHVWGTPTVSAVQREGIELLGIVGGTTWPLTSAISAAFETGVPLGSEGNALQPTSRVRRIPWGTSIVWTPPRTPFTFDAYATNRVGNSPFHALRVRANGTTVFGVGISVSAPRR